MTAPSRVVLDLGTGSIEPEAAVSERRLGEMAGLFQAEVDPASREIVYRVSLVPGGESASDLLCCTTVLQPGRVGDEYFMTAGHFHAVRERAETYLGLRGRGLVVLADEEGRWQVEELSPGSLVSIPGGWAHRTVNPGPEPLVFFSTWIADAGHDYETIRRSGFPVVVSQGASGALAVLPNPRYRRP